MQSGEPHLRWVKKYGCLVKYHGIFNGTVLLVADTKMIKEIVNQGYDFPKPRWFATAASYVGYGLLFAEGETHKRQRQMMNPAFTHRTIKVNATHTYIFYVILCLNII